MGSRVLQGGDDMKDAPGVGVRVVALADRQRQFQPLAIARGQRAERHLTRGPLEVS